MKIRIPILLLALSLLAGCSLYEASSRITTPGMSFKLPKDAKFDWLKYEQPVQFSNGVVAHVSLVISNGNFTMNPAVIDAATARDQTLIKATLEGTAAVVGAIPK